MISNKYDANQENFEPYIYQKDIQKTKDVVPTNKSRFLGSGVFGEVFEHGKNKALAVKKSFGSLVHEYEIGKILSHPNIVKVHSLFIKNDKNSEIKKYKLVMDQVQGKSLEETFQYQGKSLSLLLALDLLKQASKALGHLCDRSIVCNDIHLKNLLITESNKLMFIDFGTWDFSTTKDYRKALESLTQIRDMLFELLSNETRQILKREYIGVAIPEACEFESLSESNAKELFETYVDFIIERFQSLESFLPEQCF